MCVFDYAGDADCFISKTAEEPLHPSRNILVSVLYDFIILIRFISARFLLVSGAESGGIDV